MFLRTWQKAHMISAIPEDIVNPKSRRSWPAQGSEAEKQSYHYLTLLLWTRAYYYHITPAQRVEEGYSNPPVVPFERPLVGPCVTYWPCAHANNSTVVCIFIKLGRYHVERMDPVDFGGQKFVTHQLNKLNGKSRENTLLLRCYTCTYTCTCYLKWYVCFELIIQPRFNFYLPISSLKDNFGISDLVGSQSDLW